MPINKSPHYIVGTSSGQKWKACEVKEVGISKAARGLIAPRVWLRVSLILLWLRTVTFKNTELWTSPNKSFLSANRVLKASCLSQQYQKSIDFVHQIKTSRPFCLPFQIKVTLRTQKSHLIIRWLSLKSLILLWISDYMDSGLCLNSQPTPPQERKKPPQECQICFQVRLLMGFHLWFWRGLL